MADKKITVLGDTAGEPLTPEEEHKIEVKVDKMLAPDVPDAPAAEETTETAETEPKIQKKNKKILPITIDDTATEEPEVNPAASTKSAPPLPKKPAKKVNITITEHSDDNLAVADSDVAAKEVTEPLADEIAPEELPKKPLKIKINHAEPEEAEAEEELPVANDDDADKEPAGEPESEPAVESAEPEPEPEKPAEEVTLEPEPSAEPPLKKYRPPDGPLPFKRAEPEPETKPVEKLSDEDAAIAKVFEAKPSRQRSLSFGNPFAKLGKRTSLRTIVLVVVVLLLALGFWLPRTRAMALNLVHVRGAVSVTVFNGASHTPLSGATLQVGNLTATTDANGKATLTSIHPGTRTVVLQKAAFSAVSKQVYVSWGTSLLGNVSLQINGTPYSFAVTDYVSGAPIMNAEATVGGTTAKSDEQGQIIIGLTSAQTKNTMVAISASGYAAVKLPVPASAATPATVQLVPAAADLYVSRVSGKYNVYAVTVDGQNKRLLLGGTGNETSNMDLLPNSSGSQAAFVSTRDNLHDKAGYLLDTLTLIDTAGATATTIGHAEQLKIIGWFGNRLVYTSLKADAATNDPARYQLFAYDTSTKKQSELDHANSFNDVASASGAIYYATDNHLVNGASQLLKIAPDGSGKQVLLASAITAIVRTDYNDFVFTTAGASYGFKLGDTKPQATNTTVSGNGTLFVDSPDGKYSVRVDTTANTLVIYNRATSTEKVLTKQTGVVYPVRWLNSSTLIYRLETSGGADDYAIGMQGGTPKKVVTVVDINGLSLWQD